MRFPRVLLGIAVAGLALLAAPPVAAVDRSKFRTCDQTQFCKKYRFKSPQQFRVSPESVAHEGDAVFFDLVDGASAASQVLRGRLQFVLDAVVSTQPAVRLHVEEKWTDAADPKKRWENPDVLAKDALVTRPLKQVSAAESGLAKDAVAADAVLFAQADVVVALRLAPFGVDVFLNKQKVISTNGDKQFHFEARRDRANADGDETAASTTSADAGADATVDVHEGKTIVDYGEDGLAIYSDGSVQKKAEPAAPTTDAQPTAVDDDGWEESFGGHTDKKKFGPSSVGLDISFHGQNRGLYGIPEHASDFLLKNTVDTSTGGEPQVLSDPYRLYNLDVFEYELDVPMTLYGSIPLLVAPDATSTVGVFWHNPSETFVDIETKAADATKKSHWLSESGVVDLFFLVGPTSRDFFGQYTLLTGRAQMPPLFAVAYHQCRWNYKNEADVDRVDAGFDEHLIPYDVLWLDIEHTNGKRYFTWDAHAFATPLDMVNRVARTGRKMVTIVDPHIKVDTGFYVHDEATEKGLYIKDDHGKDFNGWCWPGNSAYVDFTSPVARRWWSGLFRYEKYQGSSKDMFTWNDMNEPSVFNGPEVSMAKTSMSLDGVEHREWHNLYGMYMQQATMEGQLVRQLPATVLDSSQPLTVTRDMQRPFVLSRAFFAGSQKYGAVWTGDNEAKWGHLKYATKMLLSMSVAGLTFVGADVGGFFGNPDTELLTRWYQAAAFQPFFRGHAHHDSARREPWLFGEPHTTRIRNAIRWRYALLPYVYTLFHTCASTGEPVMRPLWMHFPQNPESFTNEDQFLLGEDLLIKPIVDAGVVSTNVFLPGHNDVWYNIFDGFKRLAGGQLHNDIAAPLDYSPVFQRGGAVVPRKNRVRRSSSLMKHDPLTLVATLDAHGRASGELYVDDEQSFAFATDAAFARMTVDVDAASGVRARVGHAKFTSASWVERIEIYGLQGKAPQRVVLVGPKGEELHTLEAQYDATMDLLVIRKPAVVVTDAWEIRFEK